MADVTQQQKSDAMAIVMAIADVIKEVGEIPSGHLYARLMGHMQLDTYNAIIALLVRMGKVTNNGHLLRWVK